THQIRVHMTAKGHPLIGDPTYGRQSQSRLSALPEPAQKAVIGLGRQALHAYLLGFHHPANGEYLEFRSRLPNDISNLIESLDTI
ncbi:MAG TPA: RNA pseudouridine synthase, partial [Stellaceae bacterium]|nr:RNA pseudouridine synthase [Stellaceae bacterium]